MDDLAHLFERCTSVLDGELIQAICGELRALLAGIVTRHTALQAELESRMAGQLREVERAGEYVRVIEDVTRKLQRQLREKDRLVQSKLQEETRNEAMYRLKDRFELQLAVYGVTPLLEPLQSLFAWTKMNNYRIVYDSDEMEYTCRKFQKQVCGLKNIVTMVVSDSNDIFGAYHSVVPMPKPNDFFWATDQASFIYTILSGGRSPPAMWRKKKASYSILVRGNDYVGENVYYVYGCIDLYRPIEKEVSWAYGGLNNSCVDAPDGVVLVKAEKFKVRRFLALELFSEV